MQSIGRRLKGLRETRGLTRDVLAGNVGITGVTIAGTGTRFRRASVPLLEELVLALRVPDLLAKTLKEGRGIAQSQGQTR